MFARNFELSFQFIISGENERERKNDHERKEREVQKKSREEELKMTINVRDPQIVLVPVTSTIK